MMLKSQMRTVLIGVTGASSSGKSTVAYILKKILPGCEVLHEDDFFKLEKDVPFDPIRNDRDWDCPEAVDLESLKQTLNVLRDPSSKNENILAAVQENEKGYYDYSMVCTEPPRNDANFKNDDTKVVQLHEEIMNKLHKKNETKIRFYLIDGFILLNEIEILKLLDLTLFFKTNYLSLKKRRANRLYTVEGNTWIDPPGYFDEFVWPGYYKYHKHLFVNGNDETYVKETGGQLKNDFKNEFKISEYENDDLTDVNKLIEDVTEKISKIL